MHGLVVRPMWGQNALLIRLVLHTAIVHGVRVREHGYLVLDVHVWARAS